MDIRHIARAGLVVMAAVLLVTFAFAVAPKGAAVVGAQAAFAEEAPAVTASATAAPAEAAATAEGEGGAKAEKKEIPHKVGNPSPSQLQDLRFAWAGIPGFDLLIVSIIGLVATVGVIAFGAFKQMKV